MTNLNSHRYLSQALFAGVMLVFSSAAFAGGEGTVIQIAQAIGGEGTIIQMSLTNPSDGSLQLVAGNEQVSYVQYLDSHDGSVTYREFSASGQTMIRQVSIGQLEVETPEILDALLKSFEQESELSWEI